MSELFPATSMPDRAWWTALWPDTERVLHLLGIRADMTVLDLCCGDGTFTAPLAKLADGKVYALDLDQTMIDQAAAEVARRGGSMRQWICADACNVAEVLPEPVDYVLMANTFHGVPDQAALAHAVCAVLKPHGLFGIVNWHPRPREVTTVLGQPRGPNTHMRIAPAALNVVVEPAGFRHTSLVELLSYHYCAIFEASNCRE